jgi:uncharacterized protein
MHASFDPVHERTDHVSRNDNRIDALDALRGFAILGILLINIQVLSGYGFIGPEGRSALAASGSDDTLQTILDLLVRAKFYSLFSLLFGYSFVMLADRTTQSPGRVHRRRLLGLIVIGLAHSILLWPWDILLLYGLTGFLLLPFMNASPRRLTLYATGLFAVVAVVSVLGPQFGLPDGRGALATRVLQESVPAFASGTYVEVVQANFRLTGSIFVEWLQDLRPLRVLGMFLLGAAAAKLRLAERDSSSAGLLRRAALPALLCGLLLSGFETFVAPEAPWERLVWIVAETAGPPALALGYAAVLVLWWQSDGLLGAGVRFAIAPVGRMALTNYLLQSAICVPLFYNFGGGWFAEISLGRLLLFSVVLFVGQMIFSALWLKVFRQGPIEWLWRWQIKGARPPMFNRAKPEPV